MLVETVHIIPEAADFAEHYIGLRRKENRLFTDEQAALLPFVFKNHPHYHEWKVRARSAARLCSYIKRIKKPLSILEVGCGNGWLSHQLATLPGVTVTGFDINSTELKQAKRVFNMSNLAFTDANPLDARSNQSFDLILFAASIQYFSSFRETILTALDHLNECGSIHIVDTHFYSGSQLAAARARTIDYFTHMGFPELCDFYFHHQLEFDKNYSVNIIYDPRRFINRVFRRRDIFPWIRIQRSPA